MERYPMLIDQKTQHCFVVFGVGVLHFWGAKFTSKYFILFDIIINEIAFLILFSVCSLSVYRNTIGFCIVKICPHLHELIY